MDNQSLIDFFGLLFICFLILLLCIYKIIFWFKQPENADKMPITIENMNGTPPVLRKINHIRIWLAAGLLTVIFTFYLINFYLRLPHETSIIFLILFIIISIFSNNALIDRLWRCPRCHLRLPVKIRKGVNSPKLTENCPHCHFQMRVK